MNQEAEMMKIILEHSRKIVFDFVEAIFPLGIPEGKFEMVKKLVEDMPISIHKNIMLMFYDIAQKGIEMKFR